MTENKMSEVAKLLGVELEEKFMLKDFQHMYKLTEKGLMYWSDISQIWENSNAIGDLLTGKYQLVKLPKSILDDAEKEYLGNIIKPFRHEVVSIKKVADNPGNYYRIVIKKVSKAYLGDETIYLPYFKGGTIYNGMEIDKEYTLDELGL